VTDDKRQMTAGTREFSFNPQIITKKYIAGIFCGIFDKNILFSALNVGCGAERSKRI